MPSTSPPPISPAGALRRGSGAARCCRSPARRAPPSPTNKPRAAGPLAPPLRVTELARGVAAGNSATMLRVTELALPLHHPDEALPAAICKRLRITPRELVRHVVARRAHDARDKADIRL